MTVSTSLQPSAHRGRRVYDLAAFHPSVRDTDIFICTYPKSGTTWLGFLIAQVLRADPAETLDLKSFGKYVPDVNLLYTKRGSLEQHAGLPDPRFFRCHCARDPRLHKVVYVLRDPRDALLSYWHFQRFVKKEFDQPLADFLRDGEHWPCDWDEHVSSWLLTPQPKQNLLVLRYEDLHANAADALRAVLDLAGLSRSNEQIAAAVEASRFEKMRALEERNGVEGKTGTDDARFVRKGRIGSWREEMSPVELRILEDRFGEVMRRVGYQTVT